MTSLLFAIGTFTVFCGYLAFAGWVCDRMDREPYDGGQPQWRDE